MRFRLLLIDDDQFSIAGMKALLEKHGFNVETAASGEEGLEKIKATPSEYGVAIVDYQMPGWDGAETARRILDAKKNIYVLVHSGNTSQMAALATWRAGALGFIEKAKGADYFIETVRAWTRKYEETNQIATPSYSPSESERFIQSVGLIGRSPQLAAIAKKIIALQTSDPRAAILILGETGVGKEMIAKAIHRCSPRKGQRFVAVNSAALHEQTLESELFGHEKGSFTGAAQKKLGKFQYASGGTLFLDEIGETSLSTQAKLLRVLQERVITPLGSNAEIPIDVRILTATNVDLERAMKEKAFREDLYYRLKTVRITIPPLRERPEDIEPLILHFCERYNKQHQGPEKKFLAQTIRAMERYPWPGNVRELQDDVLALLTEVPDDVISKSHLDGKFDTAYVPDLEGTSTLGKRMDDVLRQSYQNAIASSRSQREAARKLGVPFSSFRRTVRRLGLSMPDGKKVS